MAENDISPGMVNILVEEEARDWLKEFITEVNTQSNRATATPYYYDLRYEDTDEDGSRHERRADYCESIFFTEKAALAYIEANSHNLPEGVYTFLCWGRRNPELQGLLENIGKLVGVPYEKK